MFSTHSDNRTPFFNIFDKHFYLLLNWKSPKIGICGKGLRHIAAASPSIHTFLRFLSTRFLHDILPTGCFSHITVVDTIVSSDRGMNPLTMTVTNPQKENTDSLTLYHTIPTFTNLKQTEFENVVGKGENAGNHNKLLFINLMISSANPLSYIDQSKILLYMDHSNISSNMDQSKILSRMNQSKVLPVCKQLHYVTLSQSTNLGFLQTE